MTPAFKDDLSITDPRTALWRNVLMIAVGEAVLGAGITGTDAAREGGIIAARRYFTTPDPDLAEVCNLAGLDPEAVRERVVAQIETAPSPHTIATTRYAPRRKAKSRMVRSPRTQEIAA